MDQQVENIVAQARRDERERCAQLIDVVADNARLPFNERVVAAALAHALRGLSDEAMRLDA